MEPPTKLTFN
jgi:hypothetical protein